jgi:small subunit ribosomal protein S17
MATAKPKQKQPQATRSVFCDCHVVEIVDGRIVLAIGLINYFLFDSVASTMASLLRLAGQRSLLQRAVGGSRSLQALALEGTGGFGYPSTSNKNSKTSITSESYSSIAFPATMASLSSFSPSTTPGLVMNTVPRLTMARRYFSDDGTETTSSSTSIENKAVEDKKNDSEDARIEKLMASFGDTSYFDYNDDSLSLPDFSNMTDDELQDTSTIPGWEMIHSPPTKGKVPKGALVGTVVSTKMQKTVNVAVNRYKMARIYRKRMRYTRKFMAHDEQEVAKDGDLVMIVPCQRVSKLKHFMLREIIKAKGQL